MESLERKLRQHPFLEGLDENDVRFLRQFASAM